MEKSEVLERMAKNEPVQSYQKTCLGKIFVQVLNSLKNEQEGILISGDPKKGEGVIHVWSDLEKLYFEQANAKLFKDGYLVKYTKPVVVQKSPNEKTDEELEALFSLQFLSFQKEIRAIDSEITLQRAIEIGTALQKQKFVDFIKQRLLEVQKADFQVNEDANFNTDQP